MLQSEQIHSILRTIPNPVRIQIIKNLHGKRGIQYSDLMRYCGLDLFTQTGIFNYHIGNLLEIGVIERKDGAYVLTEFGSKIADFLLLIARAYPMAFPKKMEGGEKLKRVEVRVERLKEEEVPRLVDSFIPILSKSFGWSAEVTDWNRKKYLSLFKDLYFGSEKIEKRTVRTFIAQVDGKIVGALIAEDGRQVLESEAKEVRIGKLDSGSLWVHHNYKDSGVGDKLVEAYLEYCKTEGIQDISAYVIFDGQRDFTQTLERLGFKKTMSGYQFQYRMA